MIVLELSVERTGIDAGLCGVVFSRPVTLPSRGLLTVKRERERFAGSSLLWWYFGCRCCCYSLVAIDDCGAKVELKCSVGRIFKIWANEEEK